MIYLRMVFLSICFLTFGAAVSSQEPFVDNYTIHLKTGTLAPNAALKSSAQEFHGHALVQFIKPHDEVTALALKLAGHTVLGAIDDFTLCVSCNTETGITLNDQMRWIGPVESELKMSPSINLKSTSEVPEFYFIHSYRDVSPILMRQSLKSLDITTIANKNLPSNIFLVHVSDEALKSIALLDATEWVELVPEKLLDAKDFLVCQGSPTEFGYPIKFAFLDHGWDGFTRSSAQLSLHNHNLTVDQWNEAKRAALMWASYVDVTFYESSRANSNNQFDISWQNFNHTNKNTNKAFDNHDTYAHAYATSASVSEPLAGDIHYNYDDYGSGQLTIYDFYTITLHEMGHSLGIAHSSDEEAVMTPYYVRGQTSRRELNRDDIDSIRYLYSNRNPSNPDYGAVDVFFRDAPSHTANRVNQPTEGQKLYPFYTWSASRLADINNPFDIRITVDGSTLFFEESLTSIEGETLTRYANTPWTATAGNHSLQLRIDPNNRLRESNESNNTYTRQFTVGSLTPELYINRTTLSPSSNGGNFWFRIRNNGEGTLSGSIRESCSWVNITSEQQFSLEGNRASTDVLMEIEPNATSSTRVCSVTIDAPGADKSKKILTITQPAHQGRVRVTIEPAGARSSGAQWRVDDQPYQNSGATVTGLSPGLHIIYFKSVQGWGSPVNLPHTVVLDELSTYTATYRDNMPRGSLTVLIEPAGARAAGARWRVDNGPWQNGGATVSNLSAGSHQVSFLAVNGWSAPSAYNASITAGSRSLYVKTYQEIAGPTSGSLRVTLAPSAAVAAGARWRVDGGTFQQSGATINNLTAGNHTVTFNTISGWTTPASLNVTVVAGETAARTRQYTSSCTAPTTPTNVRASDGTYSDRVRVTWNSVSGATGYRVYRKRYSSDSWSFLTTVSGTTYDDFSTKSSDGASIFLSKITELRVGGIFAAIGLICLLKLLLDHFLMSANRATGLRSAYQRRIGFSALSIILMILVVGCPPTPPAPQNGPTYYYAIRAANSCGLSSYSSTNTGYTSGRKSLGVQFESALPSISKLTGQREVQLGQEIAIRLRNELDIDLTTVRASIRTEVDESSSIYWQPANGESHRDIWIVHEPSRDWQVGEQITMSVTAKDVDGNNVWPALTQFTVVSTDSSETITESIDAGQFFSLLPNELYSVPREFEFALGANTLSTPKLEYRLVEHNGENWIPVEQVEGLLSAPPVVRSINGQSTLDIQANHGGDIRLVPPE